MAYLCTHLCTSVCARARLRAVQQQVELLVLLALLGHQSRLAQRRRLSLVG